MAFRLAASKGSRKLFDQGHDNTIANKTHRRLDTLKNNVWVTELSSDLLSLFLYRRIEDEFFRALSLLSADRRNSLSSTV